MVTQKDIHNILVKTDDKSKAELIDACGGDAEKIKDAEVAFAWLMNLFPQTFGEAWNYLNEEIE